MATDGAADQASIRPRQMASVVVGRTAERIFLREELTAAAHGQGRLVVLSGEAGIGKTTLASSLAHDAREQRLTVCSGYCYDLTNTPPYGPWLDLFATYRLGAATPEVPAAFASGQVERVTDRAALFADVRRFFTELASIQPLLVIFEDLHWADPASLDLLRDLSHHLVHQSIFTLVTYRSDELTRRHPFYQQLPALVREANGIRLDLQPLTTPDLRSLVAVRYSLPPGDEDRLVSYLERHAEGNPFFATELLRTLQEHQILQQVGGSWTLAELNHVVVSPILRQVIDGRVARLGEDVRQPLAIAAVIGQEVPLDLWAEIAGLDDEALMILVEGAVAANLLNAERDGTRVRFVHALTREALYESILPPRRRLWHRQVAEKLAESAQPDPDAIAYHFQQAGDPRAWKWFERAAERAQRAYAWRTAIDRFLTAAALLEQADEDDVRTRAWLLYRAARLQRLPDPAAAVETYSQVEQLARQNDDLLLGTDVQVVRGVTLCYLDQFRRGNAGILKGVETYEAMSLAYSQPPAAIQIWIADSLPASVPVDTSINDAAAAELHAVGMHHRRAILPLFLAPAGQLREAIRIGERCLLQFEWLPRSRGSIYTSIAFTLHGLGIAHASLGDPEVAREWFAKSRPVYGEIDHHALIAFSLLHELRDVALTYGAADPAERRRLASEAASALDRAGGAMQPGFSPRVALLAPLLIDGQWAEARTILDALPVPNNSFIGREVTSTRALLSRLQGEPAVAWEEIEARFSDGPATEPGDHILQEGLFLQRLAAELSLDRSDLESARAWLEQHDRWRSWSDAELGQAEGRLVWARYHRAAGAKEQARFEVAEAIALATDPDQPLVLLAAHRLLGEIETEAGNTELAETELAMALELAGICEAPFERALTLIALAELELHRGAGSDATGRLTEARELLEPLDAKPMLERLEQAKRRIPKIVREYSSPGNLTPREVEVLHLLAQHLTDREIADQLFIGHRTVNAHVSSILAKLEVDSRREAAAKAVQLEIL
jgi:DNA-binding CsgD family transcriptional regulator